MADLKPGNPTKENPNAKEWTWKEGEDFIHDAFRARPTNIKHYFKDFSREFLAAKGAWVDVKKRPEKDTWGRIWDEAAETYSLPGFLVPSGRNGSYVKRDKEYWTTDGWSIDKNKKLIQTGFLDGRVQIEVDKAGYWGVLSGGKSGAVVIDLGATVLKIYPLRGGKPKDCKNDCKDMEGNCQVGKDSAIFDSKSNIYLTKWIRQKFRLKREPDNEKVKELEQQLLEEAEAFEYSTSVYTSFKKMRKRKILDAVWQKANAIGEVEYFKDKVEKKLLSDKEKSDMYRNRHGKYYDSEQTYFRSLRDILVSNTMPSKYRANVKTFGFLKGSQLIEFVKNNPVVIDEDAQWKVNDNKQWTPCEDDLYPFIIVEKFALPWKELKKYAPSEKTKKKDKEILLNIAKAVYANYLSMEGIAKVELKTKKKAASKLEPVGCHRDFHDGNIFVNTKTNEVKLIDFDLSITNHPLITSDQVCTRKTLNRGSWWVMRQKIGANLSRTGGNRDSENLGKLAAMANQASGGIREIVRQLKALPSFVAEDADLYIFYQYYAEWSLVHLELKKLMKAVKLYVSEKIKGKGGQKREFLRAFIYLMESGKKVLTRAILDEYERINPPQQPTSIQEVPKFKLALKF